jgi:hypothetical protein
VIAGNEKHPVTRAQIRQGGDGVPKVAHAAVNEIPGDGHDVGSECVGLSHELFDERPTDRGSDVYVRELHDP